MAQQARQQSQTVAVRFHKPPVFGGTDSSWRVLCDLYPAAETPEVVMAVVEYCSVRKLDPFKRPVHIIPMYNRRLKRKVQVVLQGINEVEITASRTGKWAGMDPPKWGPTVERTFRGTIENDDGSSRNVEVKMRYPESCSVTVYRLLGNERVAFTEQLFRDEAYATSAFRSEVPNDRWQKAPRQMLHKCTKAAVLRAAFPEEGVGVTAEEMEDGVTDYGGFVIEGKAEPSSLANDHDRQADEAYGKGQNGSGRTIDQQDDQQADQDALAPLEVQDSGQWLKNLELLLMDAATLDAVATIAGHHSVVRALAQAPTAIKGLVNDQFKKAHERLVSAGDKTTIEGEAETWADDPIRKLLAEVEEMDAAAVEALATNKAWQVKTRDLFPMDVDRLNEAVATRKAILKSGGSKA